MKILKYLSIKAAIFYLFFSNTSSLFSSDGPLRSERVEEGWRYHQSFVLDITYAIEGKTHQENLDFTTEHHVMAHTLRNINLSSERKSCLLRFTPIILVEGKIKAGEPIRLTGEPLHTLHSSHNLASHFSYPELVFLSGYGDQKNKTVAAHKTALDFRPSGKEPVQNAFSMFPPALLKSENTLTLPFSLNIIQRNYMNLSSLEECLNFRYPPPPSTPECFTNGDYQRLYQIVNETKQNLQKKSDLVEKVAKEVRKLLSYGDIDGATRILDKDSAINDLKTLSNNVKMNDYACAEQAALNFLPDVRIVEYLRSSLKLNKPEVIGIVVNVHCSHTPCCSCATSFAREKNGIFKTIFSTKPIFFMNSTQNHYTRPDKGMIPYIETNYVGEVNQQATSKESEEHLLQEAMKKPYKFNTVQDPNHSLNPNEKTLYPIILISYDDQRDQFAIEKYLITEFIEGHVKKYLKPETHKDSAKAVKTENEEDVIGLGNTDS